MKNFAIKTKEINGYKTITGIRQLSIDPRSTQSASSVLIIGTDIVGDGNDGIPELLPMRKKQEESNRLMSEIAQSKEQAKRLQFQAYQQAEEIKKLIDPQEIVKKEAVRKVTLNALAEQERLYKLKTASFDQCQIDLKPLVKAFNEASKKVISDNPVYSEPNSDEYVDPSIKFYGGTAAELDAQNRIIEDENGVKTAHPKICVPVGQTVEGLIQKWMAKTEVEQITIEGESVADFRGKQYFYQAIGEWIESEVITELGVTKSTVVPNDFEAVAIEKADLTPDQSEEIRIQNLSVEAKESERLAAIDSAASEAAIMRSKLEIQGDPDALIKSQDWYKEQVILIEAKYGN